MCHRKFWNKSSENVYLKCQGMNLEERQDWNVPCISYSNVPHWSVSSWRERGKREVWRGKGTLQGSVSHGKQLKLTKKKKKKKKMHSIPSQVQAFLWGGLGRKFCFGNGVRPGLVPLERWVIEAGGIRWGGLGTLTQRNAVYLQIILLR